MPNEGASHEGSRYAHDPEYGGKLSLADWREARLGSAAEQERPMPPDHPRVRELVGSQAMAGWGTPVLSGLK